MIAAIWAPQSAWERHLHGCLAALTDDERHLLDEDWRTYGKGRSLIFWHGLDGRLVPVFMPLKREPS